MTLLALHRLFVRSFSCAALGAFLAATSCASTAANAPAGPVAALAPSGPAASILPEERHLSELRQLTFGGENAEAYWSFDGTMLSLQTKLPGADCDRIFWMDVRPEALKLGPPPLWPVSSGKGATTCAHFFPDGKKLLYASTQLAGEACPPKPDMSQGYVWALYDSYDIFRSNGDGTGIERLTKTPGYDAEGTVCAKDGSIVFTSVRDGDLELYRMDADGKNVKRLTNTPGYDGGAFFNADCSKLVWRASRPKPGKELDEYRALLAKGLVRPSKLELYVANADGTDPVQLTYLNAATFAPFFHPDGRRVLFSSNAGDPKGREFDIWSIELDGSNLERITYAKGFDGFPMFSPDGKWLAFSSNRATAEGKSDTNVFIARWVDPPAAGRTEAAPDRIRRDVEWLASPSREGRGIGTRGLDEAGEMIEQRFTELGLVGAGPKGAFRQPFPVTTGVKQGAATQVQLGGKALAPEQFTALSFSASKDVTGPLIDVGYGIVAPELGVDDYAGLDVKGKVVLARRFVPEDPKFSETRAQRQFGDLRHKAWLARERGAKGMVLVDLPKPPANAPADWAMPPEAAFPKLFPEGATDAGIPVVVVKRAAIEALALAQAKPGKTAARLKVVLELQKQNAFNVVGQLNPASAKPGATPAVVVGAHYDHLGMGGPYSMTPDKHEPHLGADDNASGTAALLEIARELSTRRDELTAPVLFIAFSGEEHGVLGSTHFTREWGDARVKQMKAMLNLDMVGRLRANKLSVLGAESAAEWNELVEAACAKERVECTANGDGYGPSDHTPFYAAGIPVLHFFTGAHSDYHKPSDAPARVLSTGTAAVARVVSQLAVGLQAAAPLSYKKVPSPTPRGDLRSFNASLGTVPDYSGPPGGQKGVLLADVRAGGAAQLAGMKRGDILIRLGTHSIGSVEDLMFALNASKPGETVTAVVLREGKEVRLEATFQESRRR